MAGLKRMALRQDTEQSSMCLPATKYSDMTEPVNIGNPYEMTIKDFAEAVFELTGSGSEIVNIHPTDDRVTDDPKMRRPDISRAQESLGWEPTVNLADGLTRTIEYFKDRV